MSSLPASTSPLTPVSATSPHSPPSVVFRCLSAALTCCPLLLAPIAAVVHPLLQAQLSQLYSRQFLERVTRHLRAAQNTLQVPSSSSPPSLSDVSTICVLVDSLVFKWRASHELLNALAFSTDLIRFLWDCLQRTGTVAAVLAQSQPPHSAASAVDLSAPLSLVASVVPLFCSCYAHLLPVLSDVEFFGDDLSVASFAGAAAPSLLVAQPDAGAPIPLRQQSELVAFLVALAYRLYWVDEAPHSASSSWAASAAPPASLLAAAVQRKLRVRLRSRIRAVLTLLRDRHSRRSFTSEATWIMQQLPFSVIEAEVKAAFPSANIPSPVPPSGVSRSSRLFSALPFVFPFQARLRLFYERVEAHKAELGHSVVFAAGRGLKATIRRSHLLEDGFAALHGLGEKLKGRLSIEFVDATGAPEPGVDGGGLFREFVSELIKAAFDPACGLFAVNDQNDVYPSPTSLLLPPVEDEEAAAEQRRQVLEVYAFIGSMVGKLVFERLQCEPRFASFFLRKLLGHVNTLDDLSSLDQQLHRSLQQLRAFTPQQLEDLNLTFSVSRPRVSGGDEMEAVALIPGGLSTAVTAATLTRYLHVLSDWKLNRSLHAQCRAFQQGLQSVIPREWLSVFTAEELRLLISGEDDVDLRDLRANTVYGSGYSASHEVIGWYWQVVEEMTPSERSALLRFVTSVPRQPLQGFAALTPRFCVQRVDYHSDFALPTSATCMHLLRLPRYHSKQQLKDRLLYAINNGVGFGLT